MPKPIIRQILAGPYMVHTYLVVCPKTKEAVLIDPAGDEDKVMRAVEEEGAKVSAHTHGSLPHFRRSTSFSSTVHPLQMLW